MTARRSKTGWGPGKQHVREPKLHRPTNPIESTFATVRHRTIRSKGCLSNRTALTMVFKLLEAAQKSWRRLDGHNQLPKLVLGVTFNDGIEVIAKPTDRQPITAAA
jgi:putative transposase